MDERTMARVVLDWVVENWGKDGFRAKYAKRAASRAVSVGFHEIGVPTWNYKPEYRFSLFGTVCIERAREILAESQGIPINRIGGSTIVIISIRDFDPHAHGEYTVTSVENIRSRLPQLVAPMNRVVETLNGLCTIEDLDMALNRQRPKLAGGSLQGFTSIH